MIRINSKSKKRALWLSAITMAALWTPQASTTNQDRPIEFRKIATVLSGIDRHPNKRQEFQKFLWPKKSTYGKALMKSAKTLGSAFDQADKQNYETAIRIIRRIPQDNPFFLYQSYYSGVWSLLGNLSKDSLFTALQEVKNLSELEYHPFSNDVDDLILKLQFRLADLELKANHNEFAQNYLEMSFEKMSLSKSLENLDEMEKLLKIYQIQERPEMVTAWAKHFIELNPRKIHPNIVSLFVRNGANKKLFEDRKQRTERKKEDEKIRIYSKSTLNKWLKVIRKKGKRHEEALWRVADYYEEKENYKKAIHFYSKIIQDDDHPNYTDALYMRGWTNYRLGRKDKAEADFITLFEEHPKSNYHVRATYWLARIYATYKEGSKEHNRSQNLFKLIIKENPLSYYAIRSSFQLNLDLGTQIGGAIPNIHARDENLLPHHIQSLERIEALISVNRPQIAHEEINYLKGQLFKISEDLSENFKLYVALLGSKSKNHLAAFQLSWKTLNEVDRYRTVSTIELLYPEPFMNTIKKHSGKIDPIVILSLIRQESAFNRKAESPVGAKGLMQLMPFTANQMQSDSSDQLENPDLNIKLGTKYLRKLLNQYEGNLVLSLAAYNAGPHRVKKWLKRYDPKDQEYFIESIPFKETRRYVQLILRNFYWYKKLKEGLPLKSFAWASNITH